MPTKGANHGRFKMKVDGQFKPVFAHRLSWIIANGDIPPGQIVCHHCDNPKCVRIEHLYLGTHATNSFDCVKRDRQARGERNRHAKLKESDIPLIRELLRNGFTYKYIAGVFNVHLATIGLIAAGKTWRHVS